MRELLYKINFILRISSLTKFKSFLCKVNFSIQTLICVFNVFVVSSLTQRICQYFLLQSADSFPLFSHSWVPLLFRLTLPSLVLKLALLNLNIFLLKSFWQSASVFSTATCQLPSDYFFVCLYMRLPPSAVVSALEITA